jgi:murein DD-endopeptidase MepM/ murein hydrolase activator NlpD
MDQQPNVSIENSAKPSKLLALIALVIAFVLPFILVKLFPHKQKANYVNQQGKLFTPELQPPPPSKIPIIAKQEPAVSTKLPAISKAAKLLSRVVAVQPSVTTAKPISSAAAPIEKKKGWQIVKTRGGDSLAIVFNRLGLKAGTLQTIIRDNPHTKKTLTRLKTNQELQFLIKEKILEKMIIPYSSTQYLTIYRQGRHYRKQINSYKTDSRNNYLTATVRGSLYTTAKHHNIPIKLIRQMTEIFARDFNFAKNVRTGDQFTIIYKAIYVKDKLIGVGDIVAVSYKNRGKTLQAVLHTNKAGHSDYFSPEGISLKKAFDRYPLHFTHISSPFSLARQHPILRYKRPHKGVDLAAPIGTPIVATGGGRIESIGRQSGYGNMIKIKHNKTYSTIYGHMLKFQKGLSKGTYVKRGQVIGFVGQTGLATGPHCHYEIHINRQAKNPTTVVLPKGDPIPRREIAAFKANTSTLLAQLKGHAIGRLAKAKVNKKKRKVG